MPKAGRGAPDPLFPRRCGDDPDLVPPRGAVRGTSGPAGGHGAGDRDLFRGPDASGRGCRHLRGDLFHVGCLIGADFAILPALFARRMADIAPEAGAAFGLWAFVQKAALALAAATMLPALGRGGIFRGGGPGKLGRGVATADMALCFGALHPETRSDGAAGDHAAAGPATGHGLTRGRPDARVERKTVLAGRRVRGPGPALAHKLSRAGPR
jgi:hypothetical protein